MNAYRLSEVKMHRSTTVAKERELSARETALAEREAKLTALVAEKDAEILRLRNLVSTAQSQLDAKIRETTGKREEELRLAIRKCEEMVAATMARREEKILSAVREREQEIINAWRARKEQVKEAEELIAERKQWITAKEADLEAKLAGLSAQEVKGRGEKIPIEEVRNVLAPLVQMTEERGRITFWSTKVKSGGEEATASNKPSIPAPPDEHDPFRRRLPRFGTRNSFPSSGGEEATIRSNKPLIPVQPTERDPADGGSKPDRFGFFGRPERERNGSFGALLG